jgi:hypothetical protein
MAVLCCNSGGSVVRVAQAFAHSQSLAEAAWRSVVQSSINTPGLYNNTHVTTAQLTWSSQRSDRLMRELGQLCATTKKRIVPAGISDSIGSHDGHPIDQTPSKAIERASVRACALTLQKCTIQHHTRMGNSLPEQGNCVCPNHLHARQEQLGGGGETSTQL